MKTLKVIKVLRVKWALGTGIGKGIVMDHYNRSLLVRHGDHHWSRWSMDSKNFIENRNKVEAIQERCLLAVLNDYLSNYSQLLPLHKKWSFPLRISSVNVTKSAGNCGFGHIYWRNP